MTHYTTFPERVWERLLDETGKHTGKWASREVHPNDLMYRARVLHELRNQGKGNDEGR